MRRFFLWCDALCAVFFFTSVSAHIPDATDMDETQRLRQQERTSQLHQQLESKADVHLPPMVAKQSLRLALDESPCFVIHRISLVGEMPERFADITDSANYATNSRHDAIFDRCVGVISIGVVIRRIQNELVRRGFVTTPVLVHYSLPFGYWLLSAIANNSPANTLLAWPSGYPVVRTVGCMTCSLVVRCPCRSVFQRRG
jgi:hemolysin activation/secretion protein